MQNAALLETCSADARVGFIRGVRRSNARAFLGFARAFLGLHGCDQGCQHKPGGCGNTCVAARGRKCARKECRAEKTK